ncbi:hypothetical protein RHMOL_Rhmol07G0013000 [Rhododendron molle]|uniref:Uncharacterized protein n=1 Tax=Rhododendron molle TaxID=49168 RepID=A0ACC0MWQ2_RHOML|nr:hypothetical protein RHMOL_Rhmol07G0013000 [Rhododendron molle]
MYTQNMDFGILGQQLEDYLYTHSEAQGGAFFINGCSIPFNKSTPQFQLNLSLSLSLRIAMALLSRTMASVTKPTAPRLHNLIRCMSNVPENTVYGGPRTQNPNQRVTLTHLKQKHRKGEPITMVTAYDYPSAVHLDAAGIDICLVGDSAAMVVHGYDTTLPITLDEMLVHCRSVARGAKTPLLVGDLPFGTYESSTHQDIEESEPLEEDLSYGAEFGCSGTLELGSFPYEQAVDTAVRVLKEGGMDAIKLEGGSPSRITAAKAIVEAGIAVMGHVGLTPQAISVLGGFRAQGKNVASAVKVVETALALQEAGCFSVVLECVPAPVAAAATSALRIPTIGIGAGPFCSGQVTPKFCKQFARVGDVINKALSEYKEEVRNGSFPGPSHTPYKINAAEVDGFLTELQRLGLEKAASAAATAAEKIETVESHVGGSPIHN